MTFRMRLSSYSGDPDSIRITLVSTFSKYGVSLGTAKKAMEAWIESGVFELDMASPASVAGVTTESIELGFKRIEIEDVT